MKKLLILLSFLFIFVLAPSVFAQTTDADLPSPGLLPDSPIYFLERISEDIGTFFTFGDLKKAERYATLAAERLAETQAVVEKGKPEFAEKTLERYEMQLNKSIARAEKAVAKGESTEKVAEVVAKVGKTTSIHLEVLAEVYKRAPEPAKPAIEKAMVASVKGHEKAVQVLKAKDALGKVPEKILLPTEVPEEARERIQRKVQEELKEEKVKEAEDYLQSIKSFEALKNFCIKTGASPEICASLEAKCKEAGITTPEECARAALTATIRTHPAPIKSGEEMKRIREGEQNRSIR